MSSLEPFPDIPDIAHEGTSLCDVGSLSSDLLLAAASLQQLTDTSLITQDVPDHVPALTSSSDLNGIPLEGQVQPDVPLVQEKGNVLNVQEEAGASSLKPAPAMVLEEPFQIPLAPACSSEAFQLACSTDGNAKNLAGQLNCRKEESSPLQEHSPSLKYFGLIQETSNLFSSCQGFVNSINENNFCSNNPIVDLFPQKSRKISALSDNDTGILPENAEEIMESSPSVQKSIFPDKNMKDLVSSMQNAFSYSKPRQNVSNNTYKTQQQNNDKNCEQILYSKALAPPNALPSTTGCAPECGIVVERLEGCSLDSYAWAVTEVVGKSTVSFIGRNPGNDGYILIFLKKPEMAEMMVSKGIWLRNRWLNVSFFQQPAIKLTISGVLPFIPDTLIVEAFAPYGTSVYPILRKIPAAVKHIAFKGACSFRREMYLVKKNSQIALPEEINISFLGNNYSLEVTTAGPRCFSCGSLTHTIISCSSKTNPFSNNPSKTNMTILLKDQQPNFHDCSQEHDNVQTEITEPNNKKTVGSSVIKGQIQTRSFFSQCNLGDLPLLKTISSGHKNNSEHLTTAKIALGDMFNKNTSAAKKDNDSHTKVPKQQQQFRENISKETAVAMECFPRKETIDTSSSSLAVVNKKPRKQSFNEGSIASVAIFGATGNIETSGSLSSRILNNKKDVNPTNNSSSTHKDNAAEVDKLSYSTTGTKVKLKANGSKGVDIIGNKNIAEGKVIIDEWFAKTQRMKFFPKRKLTAKYIQEYDNLETLVTAAFAVPNLYPASSAKAKRVQEFLSHIRQLTSGSRNTRVNKRKQMVMECEENSPPQ